MAKIRVTRFPRNTRYSILVPNEASFDHRVIKRIARTTKKQCGQLVQIPLPFHS
jgi:hypothetical protein